MPHAIHDDDWPTFRRLLADYVAGRLTKRRPTEDRVGGGGRRGGGAVKVGIAKEAFPAGGSGEVYFTRPGPEQGREEKTGKSKTMYSHYGRVRKGARVLYVRTAGGYEILQAPC